VAIADCRLCHLRNQGLRVTQKQVPHLAAVLKPILQALSDQAVCVASILDDGSARCGLAARVQGDADEPFVADYRDLVGRAVFHFVQEVDEARNRKADMSNRIARIVHDLAERHRYELQARVDARAPRQTAQRAGGPLSGEGDNGAEVGTVALQIDRSRPARADGSSVRLSRRIVRLSRASTR
jgi:hypothetical protein